MLSQLSALDFKNKIEEFINSNDIYTNLESMSKDIQFDFENISFHQEYEKKFYYQNLTGYKTLPNGFQYYGMWAGGDWEYPVFFILYFDDRIKVYVPKSGNIYNHETNEAYGNDGEINEDDYKEDENLILQDINLFSLT